MALTDPPAQSVTALAGPAIVTPAGSVSVNASSGCAGLPAPLAIVKVRRETVPAVMVAGENALVSA
ncbi:MAG TPA: hypothetical protein PLE38_05280, partial [Usitatibacteraceae bacterium]|nr:hypothetical protein [Usitatibacteraceae bacterium]